MLLRARHPLPRERVTEALERNVGVAGRPRLERDDTLVPKINQRLGDLRVVDLAGTRFAATWHVGNLDLTDGRSSALDETHEVSLTDLRVLEVKVHL